MVEDDDIYDSVINTRRQFKELVLDMKNCKQISDFSRLENVVKKFGHRIIRFKLWGSIQCETVDISENQLIKILECIPNVTKLTLRNVFISKSIFLNKIEVTKELDLPKLTNFVVDYCQFDTPLIFNKIPEKVLRSLVFTFEPWDETVYQNFFNRQSLIEKLEIYENDRISFEHLSLKSLKISSSAHFPTIIHQQPKLRYIDFAITWVEDDTFQEVCQLRHLEVLKTLIDQVSCSEFKNLKNVATLKELRLDSHTSFDKGHLYELSMMRFEFLEKLTLLCTERKLTEEIVVQMANNFHRLKSIELINRSAKIISTIIENFPNLESLMLDFFAIFGAPEDFLVINDELNHNSLKQLVVTNIHVHEIENTRSLLKLIGRCPNLERIMLSELKEIQVEEFKSMIESHRNLTHLSLEFDQFQLTSDAVDAIKSAEKLMHVRISGLSDFPSYSALKAHFQDKFPNITFYKFSTGDGELIMKKSNVIDWFLNFKLMNHF